MTVSPEQRAEINRQNAQKSTGPKTAEGKAASRQNALVHGLDATTVEPPDASYQQRLAVWVADLKPRNVLEYAMTERACRATWKLVSVSVRKGATLSVRWVPPERLRRDPFDPGPWSRREPSASSSLSHGLTPSRSHAPARSDRSPGIGTVSDRAPRGPHGEAAHTALRGPRTGSARSPRRTDPGDSRPPRT